MDYYVATDGNDGAAGNLAAPFATIQHAASVMVAGDTCYVRGGKYRESVSITGLSGTSNSPVTFAAFPGEAPMLCGTMAVTSGWSLHGGNIWRTTLTNDTFQLFVDDRMMTAARWPNIDPDKDWDDPDESSGYDPTPGSYWDMDGTQGRLADASVWGEFHNDESIHSLAALGKSVEGAMIIGYRCMVSGNDVFTEQITSHTAGASNFTHTTVNFPADATASQPVSGARYYIEADLDLLDSPGEWFYDGDDQTLYVWMDDSGSPVGRNLEARIEEHAVLQLNDCAFLQFKGLTLFAGAFDLNGTSDSSFEDCRFLYSSYGRRMLKVLQPGAGYNPQNIFAAPYNQTGEATPANLAWRNCEFAGYEGVGLYLRSNGGHVVENCYFHNGQVVQTLFGAVSDKKGSGTTVRRCTFHTLGLNNATKSGVSDEIIEYCHSYNFMFQGDFSVHQVPQGSQMSSIVHHCWAIDAKGRNGVRFDGDPAGIRGQVHHVVCRDTDRGFRLKGDQHKIHNLTALGSVSTDLNIAFDKFYGYDPTNSLEFEDRVMGRRGSEPYHGNENSVARNLATDIMTPWPLPILDTNNATKIWHGNVEGSTLWEQLRDPANLDFRPRTNSPLVNAGDIVVGITDDFSGTAPDIGAYESDSAHYWIPGCRFEQATTPVPPNGSITVRGDADLMWLEGLDSVSHDVYFGTNSGALAFMGNQTNNIFNPGPLTIGTLYYWRIDTVTDSGIIAGDEWSFTPALYAGGEGTATVTNPPVADTYVENISPTANYGTNTDLALRTPEGGTNSLDLVRHGYLKFSVDVPGRIIDATLRLHANNVASGGVFVHGVNNVDWEETLLTWTNRPPMEPASLAYETPNAGYADFDVSGWITNNSTYALGLIRGPKDSNRSLQSREDPSFPPQLVLSHAINNPPSFNSTTIGASAATVGQPYADSLAADASDPDGDPLTFSKVAGPEWLEVAGDGTLSGIPGSSDEGVGNWTVRVEDPYGGADEAFLDIAVNIAAQPVVSIVLSNGQAMITWEPGLGTLESADDLLGPWSAVTSAQPHAEPIGSGARYYRIGP
jgi:hypothetical protein